MSPPAVILVRWQPDRARPGWTPRRKAAVEDDLHRYVAPVVGPDDPRMITDSGIEIDRLYDESDVAPGLDERLGEPGNYPFTRGIHEGMYRDRLWTMRQYAGFSSPEDTNGRYRYLLEHGSTGLSMAFDLPTQLGRDSDDPLCDGEVGRTGVPIDTIEDMRICFDEIPLDQVSTSMTINAPAAILLLLYELVGEEQGVPSEKLRGTVQNDVLKEYIARGNYIYPPEPTMRLTTDIFEYCAERCRSGTRSRSPATTSARRAARRCRRWPSRSRTRSPTPRRRSPAGSRSTSSPPGWRSSSIATTTSSRRSPSSGRCAGCGRRSCASASARSPSARR